MLIKQIIELSRPAPAPAQIEQVVTQPAQRGPVSWRIRQQMLEAEDRAKAARIREQKEFEDKAKAAVGMKTTEEELSEVEEELKDIAANKNNA